MKPPARRGLMSVMKAVSVIKAGLRAMTGRAGRAASALTRAITARTVAARASGRGGGRSRTLAPVAVLPLIAVVGFAGLASGSSPAHDDFHAARRIATMTDGQFGAAGLGRLRGSLDAATLGLIDRYHDANARISRLGLTPGWESVNLGGRPSLDPGAATGIDAQRLNAALPAQAGALRPMRPFALGQIATADRTRALRCLTQTVYYEAALESTAGQEAVAQVVLNRVRDPNYPASICAVVYQGAERTTGCQFTFTCDGSLARPPVRWAWERAEAVAVRMISGHVSAAVGSATHYHADYVHPWWAPSLTKIAQIGTHIFYRWRGAPGEPQALAQRYAGREPVIDEARFARPRILMASEGTVVDGLAEPVRTVNVDGVERVVGVVSLGGRRQPTREEVAEINARLRAFEESAAPAPAPAGVESLEVIERGRPARSGIRMAPEPEPGEG